MNFIKFHKQFAWQGFFNVYQVMAWHPTFDKNNFTRWIAKGLIVRLRRGWYAFPEAFNRTDYTYVLASCIYNPSYISLQTAFGIYDMIPEAVVGITSVTSLKTTVFDTPIGRYSYYSIKPEFMFGYKPMITADNRSWYLAHPEKALLDYLYLNPQYHTEQDFEYMRFDDYYLSEEIDMERLDSYLCKYNSHALAQRLATLKKVYGI